MNPTQTFSSVSRMAQDTATSMLGAIRNVAYASLGVVAVLQEEASETFSRFVREGRAVEAGRSRTLAARAYVEVKQDLQSAQADVDEVATRVEQSVESAGQSTAGRARMLEDRLQRAVVTALQRMNVPTRDDVEALKRSVERLDKKTAALRAG